MQATVDTTVPGTTNYAAIALDNGRKEGRKPA